MQTTTIKAFVFRRSSNVNAFGLRGFQIITADGRRVFEFAASAMDAARYTVGDFADVPFTRDARGMPAYPAHELPRLIGQLRSGPAVESFLRAADPVLALKWSAGRAADAIQGQPTTTA